MVGKPRAARAEKRNFTERLLRDPRTRPRAPAGQEATKSSPCNDRVVQQAVRKIGPTARRRVVGYPRGPVRHALDQIRGHSRFIYTRVRGETSGAPLQSSRVYPLRISLHGAIFQRRVRLGADPGGEARGAGSPHSVSGRADLAVSPSLPPLRGTSSRPCAGLWQALTTPRPRRSTRATSARRSSPTPKYGWCSSRVRLFVRRMRNQKAAIDSILSHRAAVLERCIEMEAMTGGWTSPGGESPDRSHVPPLRGDGRTRVPPTGLGSLPGFGAGAQVTLHG
jgi:hypothetical protein